MTGHPEAVIIGGGAVGCAIAYFLAKRGMRVAILEKEAIGSGSSAHATGTFAITARDASDPLHLELLINATDLMRKAIPEIHELTGMNILAQELPGIRVAFSEDDIHLLKNKLGPFLSPYVKINWLNQNELHSFESRLSEKILGALMIENILQLDSYRLTLAYAQAAERLGALIYYREALGLEVKNSHITGVRLKTGVLHCKNVILSAGVWSNTVASWLGMAPFVRPLKGQSIRLQYDGPPIRALLGQATWGHLFSRLDGTLSCGSTEEDVGMDIQPTQEAKTRILDWTLSMMPCLENARLIEHLAGVRPLSADDLPIVGPIPELEGVYIATGHGRKGIHLSAMTGIIIAELIESGAIPISVQPFLPDRFR